jgi:hypothetical protein
MSYFLAHWRGKLSLSKTLWVNMVGLLIVISYAELFVLSEFVPDSSRLVGVTLASLLITRVIIFPWQLIGLLRAIESDYMEHKNILKTRALQGFAILLILFTLVYSLEVIQGAVFYKQQLEYHARPKAPVAYKLEVNIDANSGLPQLYISGDLEIGISNAVRTIIARYPKIKTVVLQSLGGQIYEGRGLARIFTEFGIDTYVYGECSSACATAFIGGKERYLGENGKLGFHQYRLDTGAYTRFVPFYDIRVEQERDLALFKSRGIKQPFLDKMFDQPASQIWFPGSVTLRDMGVVHYRVRAKE